MKNEPFEMCMLFDFYGDILTDKQKELFDLYYNNDLSLAEISEHVGITRQGVRDAIMRAEHSLVNMEQRLGLAARYGGLQGQLDEIADMVNEIRFINQTRCRNPEIAQLTQRVSERLKQLSDEGVAHGI
ncbi:MAG: YlxM family DNA-binding protein [Butyricicoccaceae bacterium]